MKKLFIITLTAALCLAWALPAMAKTSIYGRVTFDAYYIATSKEYQSPVAAGSTVPAGIDDLSQIRFNMPNAWNRVGLKWANDDNTVRALMEVRGGGEGGASPAGHAYFNYAWIDWQMSPNFYLRIGRQTQAFAIMYPQTILGYADPVQRQTLGVNYGNIHGGSARDAIRAYIKFSDMVRIELQLLDPDNDTTAPLSIPNAGNPAGTTVISSPAVEENTIPRIDVALPITFGNFVIEPSATYHTTNFANTFPGQEDSFDTWGLALGVKAGFGMFSFQGEITYGQNLSGAGYAGCAGCGPTTYAIGTGPAVGIEDTDVLAWWAQIGIKFGAATLYAMYGQQQTENDASPAAGDEIDITRTFYGVTLPISVAKGFTIRPEVMYYDNGDGELAGSSTPIDFGNRLFAGVEFMLAF